MEFIIGVVFAIVIGISLTVIGMDRDKALYPAIMIVIAFLYILYAVIGGSTQALLSEAPFAAVFIALAVIGFKSSLWFVVVALAAHGVFDLFHGQLINNPGVPVFWPGFCSAYDLIAAAYLAWLIVRRNRVPTSAA
jgi:hypothetical protein